MDVKKIAVPTPRAEVPIQKPPTTTQNISESSPITPPLIQRLSPPLPLIARRPPVTVFEIKLPPPPGEFQFLPDGRIEVHFEVDGKTERLLINPAKREAVNADGNRFGDAEIHQLAHPDHPVTFVEVWFGKNRCDEKGDLEEDPNIDSVDHLLGLLSTVDGKIYFATKITKADTFEGRGDCTKAKVYAFLFETLFLLKKGSYIWEAKDLFQRLLSKLNIPKLQRVFFHELVDDVVQGKIENSSNVANRLESALVILTGERVDPALLDEGIPVMLDLLSVDTKERPELKYFKDRFKYRLHAYYEPSDTQRIQFTQKIGNAFLKHLDKKGSQGKMIARFLGQALILSTINFDKPKEEIASHYLAKFTKGDDAEKEIALIFFKEIQLFANWHFKKAADDLMSWLRDLDSQSLYSILKLSRDLFQLTYDDYRNQIQRLVLDRFDDLLQMEGEKDRSFLVLWIPYNLGNQTDIDPNLCKGFAEKALHALEEGTMDEDAELILGFYLLLYPLDGFTQRLEGIIQTKKGTTQAAIAERLLGLTIWSETLGESKTLDENTFVTKVVPAITRFIKRPFPKDIQYAHLNLVAQLAERSEILLQHPDIKPEMLLQAARIFLDELGPLVPDDWYNPMADIFAGLLRHPAIDATFLETWSDFLIGPKGKRIPGIASVDRLVSLTLEHAKMDSPGAEKVSKRLFEYLLSKKRKKSFDTMSHLKRIVENNRSLSSETLEWLSNYPSKTTDMDLLLGSLVKHPKTKHALQNTLIEKINDLKDEKKQDALLREIGRVTVVIREHKEKIQDKMAQEKWTSVEQQELPSEEEARLLDSIDPTDRERGIGSIEGRIARQRNPQKAEPYSEVNPLKVESMDDLVKRAQTVQKDRWKLAPHRIDSDAGVVGKADQVEALGLFLLDDLKLPQGAKPGSNLFLALPLKNQLWRAFLIAPEEMGGKKLSEKDWAIVIDALGKLPFHLFGGDIRTIEVLERNPNTTSERILALYSDGKINILVSDIRPESIVHEIFHSVYQKGVPEEEKALFEKIHRESGPEDFTTPWREKNHETEHDFVHTAEDYFSNSQRLWERGMKRFQEGKPLLLERTLLVARHFIDEGRLYIYRSGRDGVELTKSPVISLGYKIESFGPYYFEYDINGRLKKVEIK